MKQLLLIFLTCTLLQTATAQKEIYGYVVDRITQRPIEGVTVRYDNDHPYEATTGPDGKFTLRITSLPPNDAGYLNLNFTKTGYAPTLRRVSTPIGNIELENLKNNGFYIRTVDRANDTPVSGAEIRMIGDFEVKGITDRDGLFYLEIPPGADMRQTVTIMVETNYRYKSRTETPTLEDIKKMHRIPLEPIDPNSFRLEELIRWLERDLTRYQEILDSKAATFNGLSRKLAKERQQLRLLALLELIKNVRPTGVKETNEKQYLLEMADEMIRSINKEISYRLSAQQDVEKINARAAKTTTRSKIIQEKFESGEMGLKQYLLELGALSDDLFTNIKLLLLLRAKGYDYHDIIRNHLDQAHKIYHILKEYKAAYPAYEELINSIIKIIVKDLNGLKQRSGAA